MFACTNIHTTHICVYARKCTYVQSVCTHNRDFVYKVQRQPQQQQHQQQHQRQQFTTLEKWLKYPHVFLCYVQYMLLSAVVNAGLPYSRSQRDTYALLTTQHCPTSIYLSVCCILAVFRSHLRSFSVSFRIFFKAICNLPINWSGVFAPFFLLHLYFFCLPKHLIDSLCILSVPDAFTNLWRTT